MALVAVGGGLARRSKRGSKLSRAARRYDVYPVENVIGEKDACGVGMMANMQKPPSFQLLQDVIGALSCMEHRGACSGGMDYSITQRHERGEEADTSGDGAGIMSQIPWGMYGMEISLPEDKEACAVGMLFLSKDPATRIDAKTVFERMLLEEGLDVLGYRIVPVDSSILGKRAAETEPWVEQIFVTHATARGEELDSLLYLARKRTEAQLSYDSLYIASLSRKTIVYKGMLTSCALPKYYKDLTDPRFEVQYAVWHRRFSTNTMPRWPLAQPFRTIGHNGEINTIQGNYNWTQARSSNFEHPNFGYRIDDVLPPCRAENSDSGNFDNYVELMLRCNRTLPEAMMIMVPEAYQGKEAKDEGDDPVRSFYEYWGAMQEPWDGPALIAFCDGNYMGASLDRNGLRPARFFSLNDGTHVICSEVGVLSYERAPASLFKSKGRLGPGQIVAIDLHTGELILNDDIKMKVATQKPYKEWNEVFRYNASPQPFLGEAHGIKALEAVEGDLIKWEFDSGYTLEDVDMVVQTMAQSGKEPTWCMGNDKPLAILSERAHVLYDYFTQRFAQVTNPPIDPYREALVMQMNTYLGRTGNLMAEQPTIFENERINPERTVGIDGPFLNEKDLEFVKTSGLLCVEVSTRYNLVQRGPRGLQKALSDLCYEASNAVVNGAEVVILSDLQKGKDGIDKDKLAIPPLLAVAAVHHYLIRKGLRTQASIVVETAQCWSTHHFACLLGYGASAICPYLALAHIRAWHRSKAGQVKSNGQTVEQCQENFKKAIIGGIKKIMSKMGISVLECYRGAQIFQCIGLSRDVIDVAFTGTPSTTEGMSFEDIANETMMFHRKAFPEIEEEKESEKLEFAGWYKYMKQKGEFHMNNPDMSRALHKAVRENSPLSYEDYRRQIFEGRPITAIRDLLEFASDRQPIPLDDVEDALAICSRFCTGGMSLGALSREAHEVIALGMNRVGGKSNCGEGGEDALRFKQIQDVDENGHSPSFPHLKGLRNGDTAMSATKQLASGRFGVTAEYLVNAEQLEIKVAQGAKPGEGGQLPGPKVDAYIAGLRKSVAGVELISPPPHHDIYSIEDLAQLIYDLHQISPKAKVSVKLVANAGIGTVAAGVAKAGADIIQISGHDGGTGASPLSSIMHAGGPWEQGLAEVQGTLSQNGLRDQVTLRIDGGFKTGWDIVTSAMMGGEEYGFGSIVMIAEGCIMARVCHENRCPVGIATQKEQLRKKFPGTPDHVANYMLFVAEEVRVILAALGYRSLSEIIGRGDLLRPRSDKSIRTSVPQPPSATSVRHVGGTTLQDCKQERKKLPKTAFVDLSPFYLREAPDEEQRVSWVDVARNGEAHSNGPVLADRILEDEGILRVIDDNNGTWEGKHAITSYDRSVGARMAGVIARKHGDYGFQGKIKLTLEGVAGQSFGAFLVKGMQLTVVGEVNDFVAKGMSGGIIVVHPPPSSTFDTRDNVICGNTCLYGASGGEVYLNGRVGDRFGVRNGGCSAVIEGCGTHLGEYMTGGVIVALGDNTGNVGAGMSGGLLYLYDPEDRGITYSMNVDNRENIFRVDTPEREAQLKSLIQNHQEHTGSSCAAEILKDWSSALQRFWVVAPPSEQKKAAASKPATAQEGVDAVKEKLVAVP